MSARSTNRAALAACAAVMLSGVPGVPTPAVMHAQAATAPASSHQQAVAHHRESPPRFGPSRLTDYDREVVWQHFHSHSKQVRGLACDLSPRKQRYFALAEAWANQVPPGNYRRYVRAYRTYVFDNC